jgi:hypothetical protein
MRRPPPVFDYAGAGIIDTNTTITNFLVAPTCPLLPHLFVCVGWRASWFLTWKMGPLYYAKLAALGDLRCATKGQVTQINTLFSHKDAQKVLPRRPQRYCNHGLTPPQFCFAPQGGTSLRYAKLSAGATQGFADFFSHSRKGCQLARGHRAHRDFRHSSLPLITLFMSAGA